LVEESRLAFSRKKDERYSLHHKKKVEFFLPRSQTILNLTKFIRNTPFILKKIEFLLIEKSNYFKFNQIYIMKLLNIYITK
jgi:hypothetical protein